jgi:His-Xaa-Ser system radical SAM maturase HxsC
VQRLHSQGQVYGVSDVVIGKVTSTIVADQAKRAQYLFDARSSEWAAFVADSAGYGGVIAPDSHQLPHNSLNVPLVHSLPQLDYVSDGDVLAIFPSGHVNVLYRRQSRHNSILTTERCNSLCLMCSQPPKTEDDGYRVPIILRLIDLIDQECPELIFSGGEPLLLGNQFFDIIEKCERQLPQTAVHVLTNGRLFKDPRLARQLATVAHHDLMLGIPLYGDTADLHDFVVQAPGAFEETMYGFYNLAEAGIPVEIRVVVHRQTFKRLPQLAEFIYRNLTFANQVVLMGMEMYGLVHQNLDTLWIDPIEYQEQLEMATLDLARRGIRVLLYNHQLCVLRRSLWPFAVKSISDWKNTYIEECTDCVLRETCGGFFQSGVKRHSAHIAPFLETP